MLEIEIRRHNQYFLDRVNERSGTVSLVKVSGRICDPGVIVSVENLPPRSSLTVSVYYDSFGLLNKLYSL